MTKSATLNEALRLPAADRYELLVELWESLENESIPLTDGLQAELRRRVEHAKAHPEDSIAWEDSLAKARAGL